MQTNKRLHVIKKGHILIDGYRVNVAILNNEVRVLCTIPSNEGLMGNKKLIIDKDMASVLSQLPVYVENFLVHLPRISDHKSGDADKAKIIKFRDGELQSSGYDALILADAAETYLRYRDALRESKSLIPEEYIDAIQFSEILMVKLAYIGMMALVDEATRYQELRSDGELVNILREDL